jgi:hypothetical protein
MVALDAFGVIVVVGRPSQQFHLGASLEEALTRHPRKGVHPYRSRLNRLVPQDLQGLPPLSSGGIQVMQGPQPFLFPFVMGPPDDIGDQQITYVEGLVHGRALKGLSKGQEGGRASLERHAGDGLSPGRSAVARYSAKAIERQVLKREVPHAQRTDLHEPMESSHSCRATDTRWRAPTPLQRCGPFALGDVKKRGQCGLLIGVGQWRPQRPQSGSGAVTDASHEALQRRDTREEHCAFDQTSGREIEQDPGPLRTEPRPAMQPPEQAETLAGVMKIAIAIGLLNLGGMIPMGIARVVVLQTCGVVQAELSGHLGDHSGRHLGGMGKKSPSKAYGAQLDRKA